MARGERAGRTGERNTYIIIDCWRREGWRREGGERSLRHRENEGMEAEKKMRRRNAEPEVSIDLDMTNERRLILRRRHPPGKRVQLW